MDLESVVMLLLSSSIQLATVIAANSALGWGGRMGDHWQRQVPSRDGMGVDGWDTTGRVRSPPGMGWGWMDGRPLAESGPHQGWDGGGWKGTTGRVERLPFSSLQLVSKPYDSLFLHLLSRLKSAVPAHACDKQQNLSLFM